MIGLVAGWVLLAVWSTARRRPAGRLRVLARPRSRNVVARVPWPAVLHGPAERLGIRLPSTIGRTGAALVVTRYASHRPSGDILASRSRPPRPSSTRCAGLSRLRVRSSAQ